MIRQHQRSTRPAYPQLYLSRELIWSARRLFFAPLLGFTIFARCRCSFRNQRASRAGLVGAYPSSYDS
eukprot:1294504-Rhodomonas_salina.2